MYDNWDNITREELLKIYTENDVCDSMVADMFGVTKAQVVNKRKKLNITQYDMTLERHFKLSNIEPHSETNVLQKYDTNRLAKALTHYLFRFGPIENMHQKGQLSEEDMYALNKYTYDRAATLVHLLKTEDTDRLSALFKLLTIWNPDWDEPEILTDEIDRLRGNGQ